MADEARSRYDVDVGRLDEHWINHPKRYHIAARKLADAKLELASAKSTLEIVEAELFLDIKNNYERYGLAKSPSDGTAKLMVKVQPKYKKFDRRVNLRKHDVDTYEADVNGYEHMKRALENLVDLWKADYFSKPRETRDSDQKEVMQARKKKKIRTMGVKKNGNS
jgi:hypothetical protein